MKAHCAEDIEKGKIKSMESQGVPGHDHNHKGGLRMKFLKSKFGLVLTLLYLPVALAGIWSDRYEPSHNSFINLTGLLTVLVTFPVSMLMNHLFPSLGIDGMMCIDTPYSNQTVAVIATMLLLNALLVYLIGVFLSLFWRSMKS